MVVQVGEICGRDTREIGRWEVTPTLDNSGPTMWVRMEQSPGEKEALPALEVDVYSTSSSKRSDAIFTLSRLMRLFAMRRFISKSSVPNSELLDTFACIIFDH